MSDDLRDLPGTTYERLRLHDSRISWVDLVGLTVSHAGLRDLRLRGVEIMDVQIDGEVQNVVINGVDVAPLVEAEMARRDPDFLRTRPTDADGFRDGWDLLEQRWGETVARARTFDERLLHERVDGEWSFIETLRHLCYATDSWSTGPTSATPTRGTRSTCRSTRCETSSGPTTSTSGRRSTRSSRSAPTVRRRFAACSRTSP